MTENPKYLMNNETGEVYAFSEPLAASKNPRFSPYAGTLPPFDLKLGARVSRLGSVAPVAITTEMTPEERIEQLAAIVHLVPPADQGEKGIPSLIAIERLSGLTGVKRPEIVKAMKMRADILRSKNIIQNPPPPDTDPAEEA